MRVSLAALSLGVVGLACRPGANSGDGHEEQVCLTYAAPAVTVDVRDRRDGAPLSAPIRVVVRDGAYADTAAAFPLGSSPSSQPAATLAGLALERPGTYVVEVTAPGYAPWRRAGVRVGRTTDGCHVDGVMLRADLTPAG